MRCAGLSDVKARFCSRLMVRDGGGSHRRRPRILLPYRPPAPTLLTSLPQTAHASTLSTAAATGSGLTECSITPSLPICRYASRFILRVFQRNSTPSLVRFHLVSSWCVDAVSTSILSPCGHPPAHGLALQLRHAWALCATIAYSSRAIRKSP